MNGLSLLTWLPLFELPVVASPPAPPQPPTAGEASQLDDRPPLQMDKSKVHQCTFPLPLTESRDIYFVALLEFAIELEFIHFIQTVTSTSTLLSHSIERSGLEFDYLRIGSP